MIITIENYNPSKKVRYSKRVISGNPNTPIGINKVGEMIRLAGNKVTDEACTVVWEDNKTGNYYLYELEYVPDDLPTLLSKLDSLEKKYDNSI